MKFFNLSIGQAHEASMERCYVAKRRPLDVMKDYRGTAGDAGEVPVRQTIFINMFIGAGWDSTDVKQGRIRRVFFIPSSSNG